MIPFNRLGIPFKLFSRFIYPRKILKDLTVILEGLAPQGYVLDVGSGTGAFIELAHNIRPDLKYVSSDPSYGMLRYAPAYALKAVVIAENLPFKNIFNLVLMGDTIHHIDNTDKAIAEIKAAMKSDGVLFIFDLNPHTFTGGIICRVERLLKEPAKFYSPEMLSDMLKPYGFKTYINRYDFRYSIVAKGEQHGYNKIQ